MFSKIFASSNAANLARRSILNNNNCHNISQNHRNYFYSSYRTFKHLAHGQSARQSMLRGVDKLCEAVKATMGPKGRNVIIEQSYGSSKITKDGVTVAKAIDLENKLENIGAKILQDVASKANDQAGDGTTCATVLARAIASEIIKNSGAGRNPIHIRKGIKKALEICVEELEKMSRPLDDPEVLKSVATISANNDANLGELIAKAFTMSKKNGAISVKEGKTMADSVEHVQGMKYEGKGMISPYFATNKKGDRVDLKDCLVLINESKISTMKQILPAVELAHKMSKPLLIIAEDLDGEALSMLILNKLRQTIQCCAVKSPGYGENQKKMLKDIAIASGAKVFGDDTGLNKVENVKENDFGVVSDAVITKDDFLLIGGRGSTVELEEHIQNLKDQIEDSDSEYDKEKLKERLAKLSDGASIVYVGGNSEMEVSEKRDRINDAMSATKAAIDMGIVPGGGVALLRCQSLLNNATIMSETNSGLSEDELIGFKIVQKTLNLPMKTIIENGGNEAEEIIAKVAEAQLSNTNSGYNVLTGKIEDMIESGVIDPTKVVISSLRSAMNVASLIGTAEYVIHDIPESKNSNQDKSSASQQNQMMDYY